ncbi:type II toxin-antitoxin system ParD family antitoxin [Bosea sp. (in: a-proteobacteria)]|uniref:type II toxin-antitoxin system ParD family antitoxin n=1 Tax=Bosea sp. (in: a-proteobacteria) TaxID=1871050 RepID=UPI003B3AD4F8
MRPLTISLSPQQLARLSRAVESGAYASNSEVVRDALRLWEQREEIRELELARLKQAYDEGKASGEPVALSADDLLARIKLKAGDGRG